MKTKTVAPKSGIKADQLWRCISPVAQSARATEKTLQEFAQRSIGESLYLAFPDSETRADDAGGPITAIVNTDDVDHYQTIVSPEGGKFDNFLKNPVVLYQHGYDWQYGFWPVGRCAALRRSTSTIEADTVFDLEAENKLGKELDRMYRKKWMRGWSIGFMPTDYDIIMEDGVYYLKYLQWDLLEYSCVALPGNMNALTKALRGGELSVENETLREYVDKIVRESTGDKTTTAVSVPAGPATEKTPKKTRLAFAPTTQVLAGLGLRDGVSLEVCIDDMEVDDATMTRIKSFMADMMNGKAAGAGGVEEFTPAEGSDEPQTESAEIVEARKFPVEWEAVFNLESEVRSASPEAIVAMGAVIAGNGEERRSMLMHHHADGRVSWRALASCMTRLLTEPVNMTDDEKSAAYLHLRAHYQALDIPCPEPKAMTPDEAYDFALEGRGTWRVDGYDWLFVEPVKDAESRATGAGFNRIDDLANLRVGPVPELGRLTDHRAWGKRSVGSRALDETTLSQITTLRRELETIVTSLNTRKGAEFSKKNRERIANAATAIDSTVTDMDRATASLRETGTFLRTLVENDDGADDETTDDSGTRKAGDGGPKRNQSPAASKDQTTGAQADAERPLKK